MKILLNIIVLFLTFSHKTYTQTRLQDSLALVSLYNSTEGASWTGWNGSAGTNPWVLTQPMTTWYGIELDAQGLVIRIELVSNNLNGTIPPTFGINNLTNLTYLRLSNNFLYGSIPNFNLPNLHSLSLSGNRLADTIPNFNLPELRLLELSANRLTGRIPNFDLLNNLQYLRLGDNQLTGSIPNFNFLNLEELSLQRNQLTDTIPNFNFPRLQRLWLDSNRLIKRIPHFNFPDLRELSLYSNQLDDTIPNLNSLHLQYLDLHSNQLSGHIPNFNFPELSQLYLYSNQLSGSIPNLNSPNLQHLWVYKNLIDSMPNLSHLTRLYPFKVQSNKLTFDDILPNIGFATSSIFLYAPQDSIFKDTIYTRNTRQSLVINLGIDGAVRNNKYKWFKNGIFYDSTMINQLVFNSLQLADSGIYTCQVTNPDAPLLTLYSRKAKVVVNCPLWTVTPNVSICAGTAYTRRNGQMVNTSGIYRDTVGCDSIYVVNLTVNPKDTTALPPQIRCNPSDTIPITTRLTNRFGCDSIVIQRFTLARKDTTYLAIQNRCSPADTTPQIQRLSNLLGCDSLVIQRYKRLRSDTTYLPMRNRCGDSTPIVSRKTNQLGCDSVVIQRFLLLRRDSLYLNALTCDMDLVGKTFRFDLKNKFGCDSVVMRHYQLDSVCFETVEIYNLLVVNGDAKNETLFIEHLDHFPDNELIIFNDKADIAFRQTQYDNTWSGADNYGNPLPQGHYMYVLFADRKRKSVRKGYLYLSYPNR